MIKRDQNDVLIDNLLRLRDDAQSVREEEQLFLKSYFSSIITPEMTFDRAAMLLVGGYKRLRDASNAVCTVGKVVLCQTLAEHFPQIATIAKSFSVPLRVHQTDAIPKISFWGTNRFSSVAFNRFASLFQSVEPIAAESFSESCEHIVNQVSDFGIIPIENTTDGRLSVFYKMLDRYELRVCAVCDVEDGETDMTNRLALVTKSLYFCEGPFPRNIEFSYVTTETATRSELIDVAIAMGISLTNLSSLPLSYRTNASVETVRLSLTENNTLPFLIYLRVFSEDANISGFYVHI